VPKCQKIRKGGLDQYGPKHFGRLIFATIRKSVGLKGLNECSTTAVSAQLVNELTAYQ